MTDELKILKYQLSVDSSSAVRNVREFGSAVSALSGINTSQLRAMRAVTQAEVAAARATKDSTAATVLEARAKAALALADERQARTSLTLGNITRKNTADQTRQQKQQEADLKRLADLRDRVANEMATKAAATRSAVDREYAEMTSGGIRSLERMQVAIEKTVAEQNKLGGKGGVPPLKEWESIQAGAGQANPLGAVGGQLVGLVAASFTVTDFVRRLEDMQSSLIKVRNNTEMTDGEFAVMRKSVLDLAADTGAATDDIAQGFMRAKNFGFSMADSVKIVTAATRSAVAAGADVNRTAEILASTMHAFGQGGDEALKTMNMLHEGANLSNTTLEEFTGSAKPVLALAADLKVSLKDVLSAFASLTTAGGFNAAETATQLRGIFKNIIAPSHAAREEIAALSHSTGVDLVHDFTEAGLESKGLTGVLTDLKAATHGHADEVLRLIPAMRGGIGAYMLTAKGYEDITRNAERLDEVMSGKLDPSTEGLKRESETLQGSLNRLNGTISAIANEDGPGFLDFLTKAAQGAKGLGDEFRHMNPEAKATWEYIAGSAAALLTLVNGVPAALTALEKLREGYAALRMTQLGSGGAAGIAGQAGWIAAAGIAGVGIGTAIEQWGVGQYDDQTAATNEDTASLNARRGPEFQKFMADRAKLRSFQTDEAAAQKEVDRLTALKEPHSLDYHEAAQKLANLKAEIANLQSGMASSRATAVKAVAGKKTSASGKPGDPAGNPVDPEAAASDAASANVEIANQHLEKVRRQYSAALEKLKSDTSVADLPDARKKVVALSGDMLDAAEAVARAQFAEAKVGKKAGNLRTATAQRNGAFGTAIDEASDRSSEIGDAVQAVYKADREEATKRAHDERQQGIENAKATAVALKDGLKQTIEWVKKTGIAEESVNYLTADTTATAQMILRADKIAADLEYKQAVAGKGPSAVGPARAVQSAAYAAAQRTYDETTGANGTVESAIEEARQKRLESAAKSSEEDAKSWNERLTALHGFIDEEVKSLESLRDMSRDQVQTLADVKTQKDLADQIFARQMDAANVYLQQAAMQMLTPGLGNPSDSLARYQQAALGALHSRRESAQQIATREAEIDVQAGRQNLAAASDPMGLDPSPRVSQFQANRSYDAARAAAKTAAERDRISLDQANDLTEAAGRPGSKVDIKDAIQTLGTLQANALAEGNHELADQIGAKLDELIKTTTNGWQFLGDTLSGTLHRAGNAAIDAVVDNAGKGGKAIPNALREVGINAGKDFVKSAADHGLEALSKRAGAALSREAGRALQKILSQVGPQAGAQIGLAMADAFIIMSQKGKHRTGGIIGGILGATAGAFLGGFTGAEVGFGIGAEIGGSFAGGGVAPGRKVSLFGEQGPELGMPESDFRILPAHVTAALRSGDFSGLMRSGTGGSGRGGGDVHMHLTGPLMHIDTVNDAASLKGSEKRLVDNLSDRATAKGY